MNPFVRFDFFCTAMAGCWTLNNRKAICNSHYRLKLRKGLNNKEYKESKESFYSWIIESTDNKEIIFVS